jgi:hypothetical protein
MTVRTVPGKAKRTAPPPPPEGNENFRTAAFATVVQEARRAGLFDGEKTEHVSFRAPPALIEAAKRETGVTSTTELGMIALAMLARPDPVAAFFRRTEGALGPDHDLDC